MPVKVISWRFPPGTRVEVSVTPEDAAFTTTGDIFRSDKKDGNLPAKQWSDRDLRPGPASERLDKGVNYVIEVRPASVSTGRVDGTLTAVLKVVATDEVLAEDERKFTLQPHTHDLISLFIDADLEAEPEPAAPRGRGGLSRGRQPRRTRTGKKRGK